MSKVSDEWAGGHQRIHHATTGNPPMILAKVLGTVVSTQKEPSLDGLRFMVVQPVDVDGNPGPGEMVLYCTGSSARQTAITNNKPCDAVIMAIVDQWEVDGKTKYKKK